MGPVEAALVGGPKIAGAIVVAAAVGPALGLRRRGAVCGVVGLETLGHPTSLRGRLKQPQTKSKTTRKKKPKVDP